MCSNGFAEIVSIDVCVWYGWYRAGYKLVLCVVWVGNPYNSLVLIHFLSIWNVAFLSSCGTIFITHFDLVP